MAPDHTRAVAEYDRAIRRVLAGNALIETHKAAILRRCRSRTNCSTSAGRRGTEESLRQPNGEVRRAAAGRAGRGPRARWADQRRSHRRGPPGVGSGSPVHLVRGDEPLDVIRDAGRKPELCRQASTVADPAWRRSRFSRMVRGRRRRRRACRGCRGPVAGRRTRRVPGVAYVAECLLQGVVAAPERQGRPEAVQERQVAQRPGDCGQVLEQLPTPGLTTARWPGGHRRRRA